MIALRRSGCFLVATLLIASLSSAKAKERPFRLDGTGVWDNVLLALIPAWARRSKR